MSDKQRFANTITAWDLGNTAAGVMSDCMKYGMTWGCDTDCPVLRAGECELKDNENAEIWAEVQEELASDFKFDNVWCSGCGQDFGPGNNGFSHCESHKGIKAKEAGK